MEQIHAKLVITLKEYEMSDHSKLGECYAEVIGCDRCLIQAFGHLLAKDGKLKDFINKAVRVANEVKGRTQN